MSGNNLFYIFLPNLHKGHGAKYQVILFLERFQGGCGSLYRQSRQTALQIKRPQNHVGVFQKTSSGNEKFLNNCHLVGGGTVV